jgi:IMP cyclohydrolase
MYLGRTLAIAKSINNEIYLFYRINSRSFQQRKVKSGDGVLSIIPSEFSPALYENPYVTYNCCRFNETICVLGNGSQVDPIFNKIQTGSKIRDAIALVLLGMDYEFDDYNTSRIVVVFDKTTSDGYLGVIREDGLEIKKINIDKSQVKTISTYQQNSISDDNGWDGFDSLNIDSACDYVFNGGNFSQHEFPVLAVIINCSSEGFKIAYKNLAEVK